MVQLPKDVAMKPRLPDESEHIEHYRREIGPLIDHAWRLWECWVGAPFNKAFSESALPAPQRYALAQVTVKASRQCRTVIELCERGEDADASIVSRALFETTLAAKFITASNLRLLQKRNSTWQQLPLPAGQPFGPEFRATLLLAHEAISSERSLGTPPPDITQEQAQRAIDAYRKLAALYEQQIGPEWTRRLRAHPWTYSGVNINELAHSFGEPYAGWYKKVYGEQSRHVHASDWTHFSSPGLVDGVATVSATWYGAIPNVRDALISAVAMYFGVVQALDSCIDIGAKTGAALNKLFGKWRTLVREE
jgi:hypothetical protein